jgi:sirohydrochlorin ferrochelatase
MSQKTALLIIDHGSRRKAANHLLFDLVKLMRTMRPELLVFGAHMELAEPTIEDGIARCIQQGATHIIGHPYMLSPGRHATEDIPRMIGEIMKQHPGVTFEVTEPLGIDERIVELILHRAGLE